MSNVIDIYNIKPFGEFDYKNIPTIPMNTVYRNRIDVERPKKTIKDVNETMVKYILENIVGRYYKKDMTKEQAKEYYDYLTETYSKYAEKIGYDLYNEALMRLSRILYPKEMQSIQEQDNVVKDEQNTIVDDKNQKVVKQQSDTNIQGNKTKISNTKENKTQEKVLEYKVNVKNIPQFMKLWNEYKNTSDDKKNQIKYKLDALANKFDENEDYVTFTTDKNVNKGLNDLYDTLRKNEKYFGSKELIESLKSEKPKEFLDYIIEGWRSIFDKENLEKEKKKKESETEEKLKDYYMYIMGLKKYEGKMPDVIKQGLLEVDTSKIPKEVLDKINNIIDPNVSNLLNDDNILNQDLDKLKRNKIPKNPGLDIIGLDKLTGLDKIIEKTLENTGKISENEKKGYYDYIASLYKMNEIADKVRDWEANSMFGKIRDDYLYDFIKQKAYGKK